MKANILSFRVALLMIVLVMGIVGCIDNSKTTTTTTTITTTTTSTTSTTLPSITSTTMSTLGDVKTHAWFDVGWALCKNITLAESSGVARWNYPVNVNLTGLTFTSSNELRIVNQSCQGEGGVEFPYKVVDSSAGDGTGWADVTFLANVSATTGNVYAVYYNNSGVAAPSYPWVLALWLDFEDNLTDKSGNGNNAIVAHGAPIWYSTGSYYNDGYEEFRGGDSDPADYISFGTVGQNSAGSGTVTAWINPDRIDIDNTGLWGDSSARGTFQHYNYAQFRPDNYQNTSATFGANMWTHLSEAWNTDATPEVKLFLNSTQVYGGGGTLGASLPNITKLAYEIFQSTGVYEFDGKVDEFMIWDNALTNTEIAGIGATSKVSTTVGEEETTTPTTTTTTTTTTLLRCCLK